MRTTTKDGQRLITQYDTMTGEVLDGLFVYVPKKGKSPFGKDWFAMAQDAMRFLAMNRKTLGEEGFAVFCAIASRLDFHNWVAISPTEIGKEIGMQRSNVSRALSKLISLGIVAKGPTSGRITTYQLNPAVGWKGTAKKHHTALQESRKMGWNVIKGGKSAEQISKPDEQLPFDL